MIFLFDKFKTLKGTVRNRHTISLLYERERNGLYTVSAEIPIKITDKKTVYNYHKKVQDSDFLGHYDREGRFQLHKIASVDIEGSSIFIKGVHLFFDEAKAGAIIQERRFRDREIIDGARVAFDAIGWSVVDFDTSDTEDYIFYNVSPLEARAILVETFGFEFDYWLDFDGKNIRNKQISVKREMGKDSNKRYNYGHNVLNIKVEQDYSEIYTAVIGRGKGEDLGDDAYGRRIEYTDVEWKTPTHPMNKPKGSRVLHDENATQLFGYHEDGKVSPRTKVEIFEDIEDPAKLLRASYNWLRENSVPKAVFSLEVPDGDGLDLGDKVHVIYRDIDLVKHTRVTKVVDDLVSGNRDVEFGDTAYFKTDRRLSGVKSELKRVGGSMSSRLSRLKAEFDRRFDNEVQQWHDDFEQAVIDAEAAVEVMRVTMTEEFEAAQKAFEDEFNQSVAEAKKHADETAEAKAKEVQDNLDSFKGEHEQIVEELQWNIIDFDGELEEARADVSEIIGRLTGIDGNISGIEGSLTGIRDSLTEVEGTLSNTKTQLEKQVSDARADLEESISDARTELEQSISNTKTELEDKIDTTEEALNQVGEDLGKAKTDLQKQLDEARAEIDGIEVGGRNLLAESNMEFGMFNYQTGVDAPSTIFRRTKDNIPVEPSTEYIIWHNLEKEDEEGRPLEIAYSIYNESGEFLYGNNAFGNTAKITTPNEAHSIKIRFGNSNVKTFEGAKYSFYRGNIPLDWTPAPEDTDAKISAINKLIEENQASIASAEESISTAEQKIEDASQTLAEHGSSISKQGVSIENIEGTLSTKASQSELDDVKGTVTQQGTSITQNANKIASKADTSTVDTLRGTVTSQGTLITQTAEELASKASQSEVDTLKGTVTTQGTSITQNANEIASKADSSEVNALKETVTQQGTSITQNSGEIATRATKKELKDVKDGLDSDITTVNQTLTEHETSITQNAESIKSKASSTELNSLKGTVTRQGTLLTQTAEQVSSKAEKSVVDTLTGRVANAESSVTQNANEIAKKLTKSVYDSDKKATDAKITQWSNTASETAEGLTRVIGRVSETEKGIDTAQTRIEAEAGRIDGVLSRTSKVEGKVQDAELAIKANADGLSLRATKTEVENAIDNIEVGGRNYMLNTSVEKHSGSREHMYYGRIDDALQKIGVGEDIVISFDVKMNVGQYLLVYNNNRAGKYKFDYQKTFYNIGTEWTRLSFETKVTYDENRSDGETFIEFFGNYDTGNTFYIKNVKIEKGNKATDWTPAPEDIDASISEVTDRVTTAEAELVVQAGEISQRATQSELDRVTGRVSTAETSIIQNADEIARRLVKSDYDSDKQATDAEITKWSNLSTETAEGLEQTISRVSSAEGKLSDAELSIKTNADALKLTATKTEVEQAIDGIEVGGRNLFRNGNLSNGLTPWAYNGEVTLVTVDGKKAIKLEGSGRGFYQTPLHQDDSLLTISFLAKSVSGVSYVNAGFLNDSKGKSQGFNINEEWTKYSFTTTEPLSSYRQLFHFYATSRTGNGLYITDIKMEKGNKATDWTPAPEDTESKITKAQADIQINADEIATKVSSTEFDALSDIVSDSSTAISQNTQSITLKANQSELNQVTQRVSSAESELSVQAGEIELRATKSELDDVEGRVASTEASLTVANGQISSVVGRVTEAETEISSVVQDVSSITSTVTSLEDELSTQGSQITQNKDVIESKVWLDDVANINPNLIPFTDVSAKESKPHWNNYGSASTNTWIDNLGYMTVDTTDTNPTIRIQSEELELEEGKEYTLSFLGRTSEGWNTTSTFSYTYVLWPGQPDNQILSSGNHEIEYLGNRLSGLRRFTHTFVARHTGKAKIMIGTYKINKEEYSRFSFKDPKLEKGSERTPFLNAFSNIEQTANSIKLSVLGELDGGYVTKSEFAVTVEGIESRVAKIDGGGVLKQSDISVTSSSVIIGSREISSNNLASIIAVSPSAVNVITNKLNLTGNLNVKGQIESISTSAVRADFANIFAGTADIQFIVAKHLASDAIQARHLLVSNAMAEKIIANTVMAREVRALAINAVDANIGSIRTKILTSDVIKSSHVNTSTALIDKIFASTAMFERMMAKTGFVRTLNTVTIDTDQITIRRPDGARLVNNGMLQASFDVQIRPNHASSHVDFTGINYATSSDVWRTFEHFYTDHKGSKLLISWAVDFYGPSASEYVEVRVRGFGGNNPIGTSNKRIFTNGSTAYLNHTINLGVPDYKTIQAYLEFRRSPTGSSAQNTVRARVLRVSIVD